MVAEIAPGDLDVAVIGQLPPSSLALGNEFEPGPIQMVRFKAAVSRRPLIEEILEHAAADPNYAGRGPRFPFAIDDLCERPLGEGSHCRLACVGTSKASTVR
jgi:hypothetical protein